MNLKIEQKMAGKFAKTLTAMCVRHTELEDRGGPTLLDRVLSY